MIYLASAQDGRKLRRSWRGQERLAHSFYGQHFAVAQRGLRAAMTQAFF